MISFLKTYTPLPTATSFFPSKKVFVSFVVASLVFSHCSSYAQAQATTDTPSLIPTSSPVTSPCYDEQALLDQDEGLFSAYATIDFSSTQIPPFDRIETTGDNKMSAVEDACNEANGSFYAVGYTSECPGTYTNSTTWYTNNPWCIGQSCTFDEYFDVWVSTYEENGCIYTQGVEDVPEIPERPSWGWSEGVFVMSYTYQFMFVSSMIMLLLHK